MTPLDENLEIIETVVSEYQKGGYVDLNSMHRKLVCAMYVLTKLQVESNIEWNNCYHASSESSNAAKERECDLKVPNLYLCRKILEAAKGISIAISHELKLN